MRDGKTQQIDTPLNIYAKPSNRFVFSFIGLSNFLPVVFKDGGAIIESAPDAGFISTKIPQEYTLAGKATVACRPAEVDFSSSEGGTVSGVIARMSYLGETVDYIVKIGDQEVRVQKGRRAPRYSIGDQCRLEFSRVNWYK